MTDENPKPYLQVGVKILLQNNEGKYLLTRQNPEKYPEMGSIWDIVGGRIDIGTPLLENLKREVKEETGLEIEGEPRLVAAQDIMGVAKYPGRHIVRLTYVGKSKGGEPQLDDESIEYRWFTVAEMKAVSEDEMSLYLGELLRNGALG